MAVISEVTKFITNYLKTQEDIESAIENLSSENIQDQLSAILTKTPAKRSKNAYQLFCQEYRIKIKEEGELKGKDVTTKLAEMWKELKDEEPEEYQKYQEMAQKEKGDSSKNSGPKKAKSAYIIFCQKNRSDVKEELGDGAKSTEVTSRLAELWNELKQDEERAEEYQEYVEAAAEEKKNYEEKIAEIPEDQRPTPTRRGKSAYMFFCKAKRSEVKEENADLSGSEITKLLSEMWKELQNDEERAEELQEYKQLAAEDKERVKNAPVVVKSKRARSAYILFCQEKRSEVKSENPKKSTTEITSILAEMWKELKEDEDSEEYQKYVEMAAAEKEQVSGEKKEVKKSVAKKSEEKEVKKSAAKKEEKEVKKSTAKKEEKEVKKSAAAKKSSKK
jgi:hypothetical protein